jgi:hypothetical protein
MSTIQSWGNITWEFFHTLAESIDSQKFPEVRSELINIIKNTCYNLPCPICAKHATDTMSNCYINKIITKNDFVEFLRQLHNIVNIILNKKTYSEEEIKNMYNNSNINNVTNNFIKRYSTRTFNIRLINYNHKSSFFIQKIIISLKNIQHAYIINNKTQETKDISQNIITD